VNILIIDGHPRGDSLCSALAQAYEAGAHDRGHACRTLRVADLHLEKYLTHGHAQRYEPDGDVLAAQQLVAWSHHLVCVYPTWWAGPPALMRLFFEMVFSPGFAFQYREKTGPFVAWDKLLTGKSARLIATMDAPPWYYRWVLGDPGGRIMRRGVLGFCGVRPIATTYFGSVRLSSAGLRATWLQQARVLGAAEKVRGAPFAS
jgi:putative NADPH-quinone reductase